MKNYYTYAQADEGILTNLTLKEVIELHDFWSAADIDRLAGMDYGTQVFEFGKLSCSVTKHFRLPENGSFDIYYHNDSPVTVSWRAVGNLDDPKYTRREFSFSLGSPHLLGDTPERQFLEVAKQAVKCIK